MTELACYNYVCYKRNYFTGEDLIPFRAEEERLVSTL